MKHSVQVKIQGREYTLRSEQSPEQVQRVADFVDAKLTETASGRAADTRDLAVFTLFNLAGQYLQLLDERGQQADQWEKRLEELVAQLERAVSGC